MMDDYVIQQFAEQLKNALRPLSISFGSAQTDMHLGTIGDSLNVIAMNTALKSGEERDTLATEALSALVKENARLVALHSEQAIAMSQQRIEHEKMLGQMRAFLQDLSGVCIGCKKLSWRPHKPDCEWSASAEKLQEMFCGVGAGKTSQSDG